MKETKSAEMTPPSSGSIRSECGQAGCCSGGMDRRDFVRVLGLSAASGAAVAAGYRSRVEPAPVPEDLPFDSSWPTFRSYGQAHLDRIGLPLGGIGTGTVSLGGRGDLRDWEIMNRPAKGFVPTAGGVYPCFVVHCRDSAGRRATRLAEGPLPAGEYEGSHGSPAPNHNLPRFRHCRFDTAYPFGRVTLWDPEMPVGVFIKGFNPLIPPEADLSGLPVAVLTFELVNRSDRALTASVCGTLPNFIGMDGWETARDWKGDPIPTGARANRISFRGGERIQGLFCFSEGVDPKAATWGTMALVTAPPKTGTLTHRTGWGRQQWGGAWLDFWDDFSTDGRLEPRTYPEVDLPIGSLADELAIPARGSAEVTFLLCWHFPNRYTWTPREDFLGGRDLIGNHYATRFPDAWEVAAFAAAQLPVLRSRTERFVRTYLSGSVPDEVKEAALFTLTALRSQTSFRTPDGHFFGFEGCASKRGCCWGSCTHVWNYEQATAFLFGSLARSMREVEFAHATDERGLMSFRVELPLERARAYGKAAADGQMGCIMKMYRDWKLSGDDEFLRRLWPGVRRSLEFCWIPGGWDADRDGVMEGCQHNTMDVEYYGPNPQMGTWYLGALRSAEEMARRLGEEDFAATCRRLFENGSRWIDENLFNGEYYEHQLQLPKDRSEIAESLLIGMGAADPTRPEYQLASGCLVDQLVGQFMAHVCGLGYLLSPDRIRTTLLSIRKYNRRTTLHDHFNSMRGFALGEERALLMAAYPAERPKNPFPYFSEVMTGFEYSAAVGMLYEGLEEEGLECYRDVRARYDGLKRNPFDEAECGHHYARAMASWAGLLALSGFDYSAADGRLRFNPDRGRYFWSNGQAWGTVELEPGDSSARVTLTVEEGSLGLALLESRGYEPARLDPPLRLTRGDEREIRLRQRG